MAEIDSSDANDTINNSQIFGVEVLARWAKIEDELDGLQKEVDFQRKSLRKRISEFGSIVALVISTLVGSYTVYDTAVLGPTKLLQRELAQLNEIITQITKLKVDELKFANAARGNARDSGAASSVVQLNNAVKLPLLRLAQKIIDKNIEHVGAASLLVIANELMLTEQEAKAFTYAKFARDKTLRPGMKAEAMRYMANARMSTGEPKHQAEAIEIYKNAIKVAQNSTPIQRPWVISSIVRDWVISLAINGLCNEARAATAVLGDTIGLVASPRVVQTTMQQMRYAVSMNSNCTL